MTSLRRAIVAAFVLTLLCVHTRVTAFTLDAQSNITYEYTGPVADQLHLASDILDRYLKRALARDVLTSDGPSVKFILSADATIWYQLPANKQSTINDIDAFTITVDDAARTITIHGSTVMSTCYGAYDFLENDIGITWLFPGELGTAIPDAKSYTIKAGSRRVAPDVTSRLYTGMRYGDTERRMAFRKAFDRDSPLYSQRHFFEAHDYHQTLKLHFLASPSHNMINIFRPDWSIEHPQVLPMLEDGTRYKPALTKEENKAEYQAWHPCYTNDLAVSRTIEMAKAAFDNGAMCYSLGINDGRRVQCQCKDCLAVGWPNSYYQYVTNVANAVKDDYPRRVLGVLVYGDVRAAAPDLKLPGNVLCMITGASKLSEWSKHADHLGRYGYFFGSGFFVPSFPLASMKHNAALFAEYGVRSFRAEAYPGWAFDGPKMYIQSRLLWNLHDDTDAALTRWCDAAFGEGGAAMKRFYLRWADRWAYLAEGAGKEAAPYCAMGKWRSTSAQFGICTPEDFKVSADAIAEARRKVKPGPQADRLTMVETYFERAQCQFDTYYTVQGLFADAGSGGGDLASLFDRVAANQKRVADLDQVIETTAAWTEGTSPNRDLEKYGTIEHEMHSGLLTATLALPESKRANVPDMLKPYVTGNLVTTPPNRIKVFESGGWYYAMPRTQYMFEPMKTTAEGSILHAETQGKNPIIEQGTQSGQYEKHWAFSLVSVLKALPQQRRLVRFDLEVTGLDGDLDVTFNNMWVPKPGDHLPVTVTIPVGNDGKTYKRTVIVEPTSPGSDQHESVINVRFGMLFTPDHDNSNCQIKATVQEIRIDAEGETQ